MELEGFREMGEETGPEVTVGVVRGYVSSGGEVSWIHGAGRNGVWALRAWCDTRLEEAFLKFVRVTVAPCRLVVAWRFIFIPFCVSLTC